MVMMTRRNFFRKAIATVAVAVVAPAIIEETLAAPVPVLALPKRANRIIGYTELWANGMLVETWASR